MRAALAACGALLALAGCANLAPPGPYALHAVSPQDAECLRAFEALDTAVERAGVHDAEADRIAGFPSLRIDRLGAALRPQAAADDAAFDAWLQRARRLDLKARRIERDNLPSHDAALPSAAELAACSQRLTDTLRTDAAVRPALLARAQVPDRYSATLRVAGLYALTRVPFFAGVERWQRAHEAAMRDAAAEPRPATRLVPDRQETAPSVAAFERDALGLPRLDDAAAERLLAAHAPVFDVEARGPFDAVGVPLWRADGRLGVDGTRPVVYQRVAHTLVHGRPLLQLVYTLWFAERPKRSAFDLLGGALDGVVVRLTLGTDGRPLMLDTMHACGCYHLFFPAPGVTLKPGAPADVEWAFVPAALPALAPGQRIVVRLESATHYVLGVSATASPAASDIRYARRPESDLQRLPWPGGGTRSLYGPDGLVAGSERAERYLFWPMGIA
ncbi:MAG TPA: hypothetical protein VM845_13330, partial [Burkholderiaceae bacterium]|nr:hypothetical protein [Burkholderiaceae bacterium]